MNLRDYMLHVKHETLDVLAVDPRPIYFTMAFFSFTLMLILLWPNDMMSGEAFTILHSWHVTDFRLAMALALHTWGMLRAIYKIKERPDLDWWMTVLGFLIFGVLAVTVDVSLGRVTLLSGLSAATAVIAAGLMFVKIRKPASATLLGEIRATGVVHQPGAPT